MKRVFTGHFSGICCHLWANVGSRSGQERSQNERKAEEKERAMKAKQGFQFLCLKVQPQSPMPNIFWCIKACIKMDSEQAFKASCKVQTHLRICITTDTVVKWKAKNVEGLDLFVNTSLQDYIWCNNDNTVILYCINFLNIECLHSNPQLRLNLLTSSTFTNLDQYVALVDSSYMTLQRVKHNLGTSLYIAHWWHKCMNPENDESVFKVWLKLHLV